MSAKFWWVGVIIFFCQLLAIAIFTPIGWASKSLEKEKVYIENHLGKHDSRYVFNEAYDWHKRFIIESGAYEGTVNMLIPSEKQKAKSRGIQNMGTAEGWFNWVQGRIDTVSEVIHHTFIRVSLLKVWAPYLLILFVPAVYDGVMTWKVKRTNFKYVSPVLHRYGLRGIGLLGVIFIILFFAPFAINPMLIPAGLIVICLLLGMTIGNTQKRI